MINKGLLAVGLVLLPSVAMAYIGPGAGLGAFAVVIAIAVALLLLVVGFVWYPLKRLLRRRKRASAGGAPDNR